MLRSGKLSKQKGGARLRKGCAVNNEGRLK